jgi:hypothetical protein
MNPKGRPRLSEEAKNRMVYARLNSSEIVVLDKLCRKLFVTRSGLLRKALYDIAEKELGMSMAKMDRRSMYMDIDSDIDDISKSAPSPAAIAIKILPSMQARPKAGDGPRPRYLDDDDE